MFESEHFKKTGRTFDIHAKCFRMGGTNYRDDLHWIAYAEEADILNVALFGFTAKAWRDANPGINKR